MLSRRPTSTGTTRVRVRTLPTQVAAMERVKEGDKEEFIRIMQQGNLGQYGMTTRLSQDDISKFSADQLYELAYGGAIEYWRSPVFNTLRLKENEFISDLTREINVVESIYSCPACAYTRILVSQEQKGGGDESMTTMFRCTKCGHPWSNSGRG